MYHCQIAFYCIGQQPELYQVLQGIPPLPDFSHAFRWTAAPDPGLFPQADVILADLRQTEPDQFLQAAAAGKKPGSQLILLAEQAQLTPDCFSLATDIWLLPADAEELRFRFRRWQEAYRQQTDLWAVNQYLDATINSTPSLVWYKSRAGVHEKVNDSFCRAVKKPADQVVGRTHAAIWNVESDDPACIQSEEEVMSSRQTCVGEEIIQTGEGLKVLKTHKSPLYDVDGSVMGTVGVALDITQERDYEAELLKKKNALETIFMSLDCGILCHNLDGSIREINRAALLILGYESLEEMEADGFDTIAASVVEEDWPKLRQCIRSLQREGESTSAEYRVQHKDGSILHVMGNVKLVSENGELFYQRFLLDCTAQKLREQAEQSKMNSRIKYQEQLFDVFSTYLSTNTDDVYMMLAEDGKTVEYVSPNVERVLGIPPESAGLELWQSGQCAAQNSENENTWEILSRLQPGESLEPAETMRINAATGERKWFHENVYCVELQGKKKIIRYISDRTKEKKAQDDLTAALDIATVASQAKSNFLSSVSHDIRTPLNAIMGFVTLLRDEPDDPKQVMEYAQQIDAAGRHLLQLISDVLDMNKIESGAATLNISELNLTDVIEEAASIIRPQAQARRQSFTIHTAGVTSDRLMGDQLRISQILLNILSNAVKYTQEGGTIIMTVAELPQVTENYSRVQFVISDNGRGMSQDYLEVIFNPFTREHGSLTNKVQGTGLGMAITKSLVDMMGGSIRVESIQGRGSTFIVELELRVQKNMDCSDFWRSVGISRVLVVEANSDSCGSIINSIAGTGLKQVDATASGDTAAKMLRKAQSIGHPYDLILLDWELSHEQSGLEAARIIRNVDTRTPVLVFSDFERKYIEKEAYEADIHFFLTKPFSMNTFKDAVRRLTDSQTPEETAISTIHGKRILVVDDIDVNRLVLVKILTTLGAVCDTAEDGQKAVLKFLSADPTYDAIMMDIQMPVMDGYAATRAIRASGHPCAKTVAIMAMTANAFSDDVRAALEAGMDAHIAKPIVLPQMQSIIEDVLREKAMC